MDTDLAAAVPQLHRGAAGQVSESRPSELGPAGSPDPANDPGQNPGLRRANVRLAIALAVLAGVFYLGFIVMSAQQ